MRVSWQCALFFSVCPLLVGGDEYGRELDVEIGSGDQPFRVCGRGWNWENSGVVDIIGAQLCLGGARKLQRPCSLPWSLPTTSLLPPPYYHPTINPPVLGIPEPRLSLTQQHGAATTAHSAAAVSVILAQPGPPFVVGDAFSPPIPHP